MLKSHHIIWLVFGFFTFTGCADKLADLEEEKELSGDLHFPGEQWDYVADLEAAGWSEDLLKRATNYASNLNTASYVAIHKGRIIQTYGEIDRKFKCHSIRKSFLSALYGIHVEEGRIDLNATLEDLGIDDNAPSLSQAEKQATVEMLLQARSGVYHPALYETAAMAANRPERHSHEPGTFYYYNNWDFNTLGTIFEQETGTSIFDNFDERIAKPVGMEQFNPDTDCEYYRGAASIHPAYLFEMDALDMARFGLLYARGGKWKDQQIIPEDWIKASVTSYSNSNNNGGYGYLWWVAVDGRHFGGSIKAPEGLYTARGSGGQLIAVIPDLDFVLVHRANTYVSNQTVTYRNVGHILERILLAYKGTQ